LNQPTSRQTDGQTDEPKDNFISHKSTQVHAIRQHNKMTRWQKRLSPVELATCRIDKSS